MSFQASIFTLELTLFLLILFFNEKHICFEKFFFRKVIFFFVYYYLYFNLFLKYKKNRIFWTYQLAKKHKLFITQQIILNTILNYIIFGTIK